jgi:hypothetical protein
VDTKEYYIQLTVNTNVFLEILRSCNKEELHFKPEGKWSILEIAEHILIAERTVNIILYKNTDSKSIRSENYGYEKLNHILVDKRSSKIQAPDSFQPKGKLKSVDEFETALKNMRATLQNNIESGKLVVDDRTFKHPVLGEMTVKDWLYFIPLHASRHIDQIRDLLKKIRGSN